MKLQRVGTKRNGVPCTALVMDMDKIRQVENAFLTGVRIDLSYVNLKGVMERRACYIEGINPAAHVFTIKDKIGGFGFRTVCFERVLGVK